MLTPEQLTRVKEVIVETIGCDEGELVRSASFEKDLGADSLQILEISMAMEEEFGIEIPDDDAEKLLTVGQLTDYVAGKVR